MALLSKTDIFLAKDSQTIKVRMPEWGGDVIVSTMSGFSRDQFEMSVIGKNGGQNVSNIRAKLVAACLVDDKGNLLFTDADVVKLGKKSGAALDKIFTIAQKLNKIGDEDVEELAKN